MRASHGGAGQNVEFGSAVIRWEPAWPDGARMFTPGAIKSGLIISGVSGFGPREENEATTGAGRTLSRVPLNCMVAVGGDLVFEATLMYFLISSPTAAPTAVAGSKEPSRHSDDE
nr:hypothetical protein CDL15_Pgr017166 [Ipomoea batatas]